MVVGVPVALILMFNFVALSFTMVSIWKVQKVRFEIWISNAFSVQTCDHV